MILVVVVVVAAPRSPHCSYCPLSASCPFQSLRARLLTPAGVATAAAAAAGCTRKHEDDGTAAAAAGLGGVDGADGSCR
uniref:Putative secreted protein n=1 Tax=Anopheles darlingi TaxID=43151 RepID=A0A2M4DCA3_ANODA